MPWTSGTFSRTNGVNTGATVWQEDRNDGTRIRADRHDTHDQDIASGINLTLTKDGQNSPTANLPMATFRHTGVGNAQARTDYAAAGQIQDGALTWLGTAGGTANALTASLTPAITAYVGGMRVALLTSAANTGTATIAINGLAAKAIKRKDGATDLSSADFGASDYVELVYDGTVFRWCNQPFQLAATGDYLASASTGTRAGYVRANGRTIGSATSGATERANADTAALYALLWGAYANTILAIQDSSGSGTTRGASAAADFAADKRLPLPDLRGRALFGLDDMGASAASRITSTTATPNGTTIGASGGAQTHTLVTAEMPTHNHAPTSGFLVTTTTQSNDVDTTGAGIRYTGVTNQTADTGGGGAHNNMPPFWLSTIYIRL